MANSTLQVTYRTKKTGTGTQDLNKELKTTKLSITDVKSALDMATGAFQAVAAAVQSVINPVIDYAAEVRTLSRTIGSTAEESSKLIQAADDVGISAGTLQGALEAAIKRGVAPTIDGIADLADEYNAIQDPIEKTKFLMDNFGKSGADLGPLMEQGAAGIRAAGEAAADAGLVMSQDAVDAAREYEIAMDNLDDALMAVKLTLARELIPQITASANEMTAAMSSNQAWTDAIAEGIVTQDEAAAALLRVRTGASSTADELANLKAKVDEYHQGLTEVDPAVQNMRLAQEAAATATVAYSGQIQSQTQWLEDLAAVYTNNTTPATYGYLEAADLLSEGLSGLTEQMIFQKAAMNLSDEAALQLGISMGLVDTRVLALNEALPGLKAKFDANHDGTIDATEAANGYTAAVNALTAALMAVPANVTSTVTTNFVSNGTNYGGPAGPPQGPIPQAEGGDWLVTQPTLFLAGEAGPERATFTPLGGGGNQGGGGDTYYVTINAGGANAQGVADILKSDDIRRRTGARRA